MSSDNKLRVTEIFYSLQGESLTVGVPTVFIRLTGCPLRCGYCDTEYAFTGGQWMQFDEILQAAAGFSCQHVTVTGGEPLAQKSCLVLLTKLCDAGFHVSLETSGALDISLVDQRVTRVMDIKTPSSGEQSKNLWDNIDYLTGSDQIKFVIGNRVDYDWAKHILYEDELCDVCEVLFSPVYNEMDSRSLAEWILQDRLPVRFQLQLHKLIWGDEPGR